MRTIITRPRKAGKYPGFMFIQGFSPVSYDFTLEGSKGDVTTLNGPLLYEFANSNFVTIRVEKPGVGDSEGGPFADLDFTTEIDIYRQALKQLKEMPEVDTDNVFIFGHSMGGAFGPIIASENPVRGIAVYGAASRTWYEYLLDTLRYQGLVAGDNYENTDERVRLGSRALALVFLENKSPEEVNKSHPELKPLIDALFPNGQFNGKSLEFWRQLGQENMPSYWTQCNAHVLAVRGASDFVTYDVDHKLIADIVNRAKPDTARSLTLPDSDHLFHKHATEPDSMKAMQKGEYNLAFATLMKAWIQEVMDKTSKKGS
jgi:pimeloyl-ACP methyl ester carboxylesterase